MRMGRGFWLNPANGRWVEVATHDTTIHDKEAQARLCLTEKQVKAIDAVHGDPDKVRMAAVKAGLIRIRDYEDGLHVEYQAKPGWKKRCKRAIRRMIEEDRTAGGRLNGTSQAWQVKETNL